MELKRSGRQCGIMHKMEGGFLCKMSMDRVGVFVVEYRYQNKKGRVTNMIGVNDSRILLREGLKNQIITARNRLKAFREKKVNDELTFEDVRVFSSDFERVSEWIKSSLHSLCDDISEKGALNSAKLFVYEIEKDDVQIVQAEDVLKILSFYVDKLNKVQEIMREEIKI